MSAGSILAILFDIVLSAALPIGLMLWLKRRGGSWSAFLTGAGTFVLFALVLEALLHQLVLQSPAGEAIRSNIWLYGLYGGLAAGIFEETGRFAAFKCVLRRQRGPVTALAYGAGHGGAEALLVLGASMVSNLVLVSLAGNGSLTDPAMAELAETVMTTPTTVFLWAGFERGTAVLLHMANSVLVFTAASRPGQLRLFPLAIGTHTLTNFIAVTANAYLPIAATELLTLIFAALVALLASRIYRNLQSAPENA